MAVALLATIAAGSATVAIASAVTEEPKAVYRSLGRTETVVGAPERALGLSRVTIDSGARIPFHFHEGTQIAFIQRGSLNYTVKTGGVTIRKGPGDDSRIIRRIGPGQTGMIRTGNWIVEQPGTIHRAANPGRTRIVIYLANLLKKAAAPSTPVS